MNAFLIILVTCAVITTVLSWASRKRQKEELLTLSIKLHENFNLLFFRIEEKIKGKQIGEETGGTIGTPSSVQCSDLVLNLIKEEIKNHAVADLKIIYKHDKVTIYSVSPYESREYNIESGNYTTAWRNEDDWADAKAIEA